MYFQQQGGYGGSSSGYAAGSNSYSQSYQSNAYQNSSGSIDDFVASAPQTLTLSQAWQGYIPQQYARGVYLSNRVQDYFVVDDFLTNAKETDFVDDAKLVEVPCREAFKACTGKELPRNIMIRLCSESELKKFHSQTGGVWSSGIQGFSLNRGLKGVSEVFVKKDFLDRVMLTLGHEIGHVISPTLQDSRDEEAKAFAFSIAWMRAIVENNIAGLTNAINPNPARNGLHDAGFGFVQDHLNAGTSAFETFTKLAQGLISITQRRETIITL